MYNRVLFLMISTRKPEAKKIIEIINNIKIAGISRVNPFSICTKNLSMKYSTINTIARKEKNK